MTTDQTVTVRLATPVDAEAAVAVLAMVGSVPGTGLPALAGNAGRARQRLTAPGAFFVIAESRDDGGPVGVAAGIPGREDGGTGPAIPGLCHITMVAVRPECWGRGVGKRLVRALISELGTRGYDRVQLFTQAENMRAQRLYAGLGFRPTGRTAVSDEGEALLHYLLAPLP
jgi:ribosomal protein S18 acetylase RimI-like enzyme